VSDPNVRHYAALILRDGSGRYFTLHHSKKAEHQWRFPGGKVDQNEIPINAAIREAWEELGIAVTGIKLVEITEDHFTDKSTWRGHFFEILSYDGVPSLREPDKHDDWQYLDVADLKREDAHPEYEVALKQTGPELTAYGSILSNGTRC
jgi:8-oxo-dGTP diphosphatase